VRNLAFIGKKRAGKDSAAEFLVREFKYTRLAFADDLKRMAIETDPYVPTVPGVTVRLSTLIADVGWEYAKDHYPEVRRLLQRMGQTVRELDPDFWIRPVIRRVKAAQVRSIPVVVTDVRYQNEAEALRDKGFTLVRIVRPVTLATPVRETLDRLSAHPSETELDSFPADTTVTNDGTLDQLRVKVRALA